MPLHHLGSVPSSGFLYMPTSNRSPTNVNVNTKVPNLSPIIPWLSPHFRFQMASYSIFLFAASYPFHPFSPLLSMWYIDTDIIVSFPKSHMDFRIHSQPSAWDSVKQASTVQSGFLFPASHENLVSRAAGPNPFPKDTVHFPHICPWLCLSVQCPLPSYPFLAC